MKPLIIFGFAIICIQITTYAQSDTTIVYLTELGDTTKENAVTYTKFYKTGNLWHGRTYFTKNGVLKSEGKFRAKMFDYPVGTFKNYTEQGTLSNIATYNDSSQLLERTYFFENGMKQALIYRTDKGKYEEKCWDLSGKETSFCKIEIEARFKGGMPAWMKYLEQNLNARVAADAGAPAGIYRVVVWYVVNKDGEISNIRVANTPEECKPCVTEAIRVLRSSPRWEPAYVNGVPSTYLVKQNIVFMVEEEKRGRRKRN